MSGFGLDHLPYGVFAPPGEAPRVGVRVEDRVLDLAAGTGRPELARPSLNEFMALGPRVWAETRPARSPPTARRRRTRSTG